MTAARKIIRRDRGAGATTRQMIEAKRGAVYLWPVGATLDYAKALARRLGRDDLEIKAISYLDDGGRRLLGKAPRPIVLDHACEPTNRQHSTLSELRALMAARGGKP